MSMVMALHLNESITKHWSSLLAFSVIKQTVWPDWTILKGLGANFLLIKVTLVIFTWAVPFLSQRSNHDWTNPNYYLLPWIRLSRDNELYFWLNFPEQKIIFRFVDDLPLRIRAFLRPTRHCSMRILLRTLIMLKPEFWGMN